MMTVIAIMTGLLPILRSCGTGSELMRRIAVPMVGCLDGPDAACDPGALRASQTLAIWAGRR